MATKTSLLGLTKPDYSDVQDVGVINGNMEIIDKEMGKRSRVYNLLDNSDFQNPVNQRGQSSYTAAGYTLDRWHQNNAGTVTQSDNGVTITPTAPTSYFFRQFLSDETIARITGKTVTIACCTSDGTVYSATGTIPSEPGQYQSLAKNIATNWRMMFYRAEGGSCQIRFLPTTASAGQLGLKWAALYEGSYTTDTLPAYLQKGYGVELAECKRYDKQYSTIQLPLTVTTAAWAAAAIDYTDMRETPSVTYELEGVYIGGTKYTSVKSITARALPASELVINIGSSVAANQTGTIRFNSLALSAGL